jgi:FKBP-type peptidyl-prolyl cis-trans isomerase
MRRSLALVAIPLITGLALAGCGSSSSSKSTTGTTGSASSTSTASGNGSSEVTASGAFDKSPTVTIPKATASSSLVVKTLITGTGPALTSTDAFLGNYVVYSWDGTTHALKGSTYGTGSTPTLFSTPLLPGLTQALSGAKVGSRVLAVIPPKDGFGTSGNTQDGISGTTTLVFVIDVLKAYPGTEGVSGSTVGHGGGDLPTVTEPTTAGAAPTVTMPSSKVKPPKTLQVETLIKGTGAKVASGDYVVVQYVGYIWRTGKTFDSSWSRKTPFGFEIGAQPAQVITGWDTGLRGVTVGSRVMLVIPPSDGYGSTGASQAGITGTDTLVFVVDVIDAYSASSSS